MEGKGSFSKDRRHTHTSADVQYEKEPQFQNQKSDGSSSSQLPRTVPYFSKPSNPTQIQQKIDEISMDQMETWDRIKVLEQKIENQRKQKAEQTSNISSSAHEKIIEEFIRELGKEEEKDKLKRYWSERHLVF